MFLIILITQDSISRQDVRCEFRSGESSWISQDKVYNCMISVWMNQEKPDKQASVLLGDTVTLFGLYMWAAYSRPNTTHPHVIKDNNKVCDHIRWQEVLIKNNIIEEHDGAETQPGSVGDFLLIRQRQQSITALATSSSLILLLPRHESDDIFFKRERRRGSGWVYGVALTFPVLIQGWHFHLMLTTFINNAEVVSLLTHSLILSPSAACLG